MSAEQLDITVGASDKFKNNTKGLMGVFNGDPNDDLLPPGENAVPLANSSSEKTIFKEFGEKCTRRVYYLHRYVSHIVSDIVLIRAIYL